MAVQLWPLPFSFPSLLARLGINRPDAKFDLASTVFPVSLVDADIAIPVNVTPVPFTVPASAGELAAPVNGTRLADTGQLAAGSWVAWFWQGGNTGTVPFRFGKRDAADAAWVWSQFFANPVNAPFICPQQIRVQVAASERLVLELTANTAGTVQGGIWAARVSA